MYKKNEGDDFHKIYEVLSTLKNKILKMNNILKEKKKVMIENPDFEQDYYTRKANAVYKIGRDSFRLMKCLA